MYGTFVLPLHALRFAESRQHEYAVAGYQRF